MSVVHTLRSSRRALRVAWLPIGGYTVATLDMLVAMAYWAPHGVHPSRILQGIASWVLGPSAFMGGSATAVLGALFYGQLLWGVVALYHALAQRYPILLRHPFRCGAIYGALAYGVIFQVVAPLLTGVHGPLGLEWVTTCVLTYSFLVGIPCALFSRLATTS